MDNFSASCIIKAALTDKNIDGMNFEQQYLYNSIVKIKYDFEKGKISKEEASSRKTYAGQVEYVMLKTERSNFESMILEICHAAERGDLEAIQGILIKNKFNVKGKEQEELT